MAKIVSKTQQKKTIKQYKTQLSNLQSDFSALQQAYNEATNATAIARENTLMEQQYNAEQAQIARDWQTEMSNTSHQREVADLKKAGLNPVLSANGGAQSYTTSAASAGVDSSVNAVANMYNTDRTNANAIKLAQMNNKVNLKIAKMNYKVGIQSANAAVAAARASAGGAIGAASISAGAQNFNTEHNFITNPVGYFKTQFNELKDVFKSSAKSPGSKGNLLYRLTKKK